MKITTAVDVAAMPDGTVFFSMESGGAVKAYIKCHERFCPEYPYVLSSLPFSDDPDDGPDAALPRVHMQAADCLVII